MQSKIDWNEIQLRMKSNFGNDIFESWLRKLNFVEEFKNYIDEHEPIISFEVEQGNIIQVYKNTAIFCELDKYKTKDPIQIVYDEILHNDRITFA